MEGAGIRTPNIAGREKEIENLKSLWHSAANSGGKTVFISGEAGIGKTRLTEELINMAKEEDVCVIKGWCLSDSMEPLMPVKTGLRDAGLGYLVSGESPPLLISLYLIERSGILIAKSERTETDMDSDIFASMLQAVAEFVKDALSMMGKEGAGLNSLGYGRYRIVLQRIENIALAAVIDGTETEFLIEDMRKLLEDVRERSGEFFSRDSDDLVMELEALIKSGRYDGKFLVDDPEIKQENLFDNILMGISRESRDRPVLIFFDDLQWADPTTLNLIHYISRNIRDKKVLMLCTYRPEDIVNIDGKVDPLEDIMRKMSREELFERMEIKRLDEESTKRIIESALGEVDFKPSFYRKIYRETEGIPFFILEVLKLLSEEGEISYKDGVWYAVRETEDMEIPMKIYDVVKRRLETLTEREQEMLECASVIGEEFSTDVLARVSDMKRMELLKNLSKIEKTHRLIRYIGGKYRFDHAKIREVLYEEISEELRREYHRIVAKSLEEIYSNDTEGVLEDIAYHYNMARDSRAGKYLLLAGNKEKENYANEEALWFYRKSMQYVDERKKPEILEDMGDILVLTGEYDAAIESYGKAENISGNGEEKIRLKRKISVALERKGNYDLALKEIESCDMKISEKSPEYWRLIKQKAWILMRKGEYDKSMELNETAIDAFKLPEGNEKDLSDCYNTIGACFIDKGDFENALEYLKMGLNMRERIGDQQLVADSYNNIGLVFYSKGDLNKAMQYLEKSLEIREKIGARNRIAVSYNNMGVILHTGGNLDMAMQYLEKSLEIREKIGDMYGIATSYTSMGGVMSDKGELDVALELLEKAMAIQDDIGDRYGMAFSYGISGIVFYSKGDFDKAMQYLEKSLEIREDIGDRWGIISSKIQMANLLCLREEYSKAEKLYFEMKSLSEDTGVNDALIAAMQGLAEVYLAYGKTEECEKYLTESINLAEKFGMNGFIGMGNRIYGEMLSYKGMQDEAELKFFSAEKIFARVGMDKDAAITGYHLGKMLILRGNVKRGREILYSSLEFFRRKGMNYWEKKSEDALSSIR